MPTRTHGSARPTQELTPVVVVVADGPAAGLQATLTRGSIVIGSGTDCDLVVSDPTISRRHASAGLVPGGLQVKDLGSRNGTRYLGARIETALIPIGASLKLGRTTLEVHPVSTDELLDRELDAGHGLLGKSRAVRKVFSRLPRVASSDAAVLLRGETGTGKSQVARVLHDLSPRAAGPFVVIECASLTPTLFASTLFGHLKGSFTGASRDHQGLVATAQGGTLFLDEVAEVPLELQPALLRLLESGEYLPLGAARPSRSDARVVASTARDLEQEMKSGRFRRDLYFRLAGVELTLPPLRERRDDIAPLARHFAHQLKGVDVKLGAATIAAFQCQAWRGNLRELKNAVARALTLGDDDAPARRGPTSFAEARDEAVLHFERDYLEALLRENGGNVSAAARAAQLARSYFYTLLERHGLVSKPKR